MIGFPNLLTSATVNSGSWINSLPLANILGRTLGRVARSVGLSTDATRFIVDLGSAQDVRLVALINHNLSIYAKVRIEGSNDASFSSTLYDSGWTDAWPDMYPYGSLEWEDDRWWSRKYTLAEIKGYVAAARHILPSSRLARYWRITMSDPTNTDGYVQLGRVFIGPVWQPTYNYARGSSLTFETKTDVQEALGGAEYFQERKPYRVTKFSLEHLTEDQAMFHAFELDRLAGISGEVFWIQDPEDTIHSIRRQYLGRFRQLSALDHPYFNNYRKAYEIKELL
ncbi:hypothetical protein [Pseudoduganella sp. RAF53_2]|uniref:hypothetical protein n=1 Tax=unclassified Pseudoduganella TaxID=2637179 RepID=UPI003F993DB6